MSAAKRLIPLLDRVLVEKVVAPTKSLGGVLLPEVASAKVRYVYADLPCTRAGLGSAWFSLLSGNTAPGSWRFLQGLDRCTQ